MITKENVQQLKEQKENEKIKAVLIAFTVGTAIGIFLEALFIASIIL